MKYNNHIKADLPATRGERECKMYEKTGIYVTKVTVDDGLKQEKFDLVTDTVTKDDAKEAFMRYIDDKLMEDGVKVSCTAPVEIKESHIGRMVVDTLNSHLVDVSMDKNFCLDYLRALNVLVKCAMNVNSHEIERVYGEVSGKNSLERALLTALKLFAESR